MNGERFDVVRAGDSTLIVRFADRIDPAVNARAISLARALADARLAGVRDVAPTYRSVAVHFDPLRTDYDALVERVEAETARDASVHGAAAAVRVPVCYGGEFGPDLAAVAAFANVTEADAIGLHTSRTYRVFMLGFVPGFAYMGTVDARIAAPRLASPRPNVPAGSVGIAGVQTGIYPCATPGGWQIVGRTPIETFDLRRTPPCLFEAGDSVEFHAIGPDEYRRLESSG